MSVEQVQLHPVVFVVFTVASRLSRTMPGAPDKAVGRFWVCCHCHPDFEQSGVHQAMAPSPSRYRIHLSLGDPVTCLLVTNRQEQISSTCNHCRRFVCRSNLAQLHGIQAMKEGLSSGLVTIKGALTPRERYRETNNYHASSAHNAISIAT